jgi:hypothetical protein
MDMGMTGNARQMFINENILQKKARTGRNQHACRPGCVK